MIDKFYLWERCDDETNFCWGGDCVFNERDMDFSGSWPGKFRGLFKYLGGLSE